MKNLFLALVVSLGLTQIAQAETSNWGVGAVIGDPVALTVEQEFSSNRSIEYAAGYSWGHDFLVYADYQFHFPGTLSTSSSSVNAFEPYIGLGPELRFYNSDHKKHIHDDDFETVFSARIPVGVAARISNSPFKVFAEIVPLLNLVPGLTVDLAGGVGFRFFF